MSDRACTDSGGGVRNRPYLDMESTVLQPSILVPSAGAGYAMREQAARDIDPGEDRLQLADVAQQYYLEDLTQEQIARGMGVSRSHVSRMLKVARERGIVEIRIHHPLRTEPDLQQGLLAALPLIDTLVLAAVEDSRSGPQGQDASGDVARQLGVLAARYLDERITDHAIVGVGWGSTVYHVVTSGYLRRKQSISSFSSWGSVGGGHPGYRWWSSRLAAGPRPGWEGLLPAGSDGCYRCWRADRALARSAHWQDAGVGTARQCAPGLGWGGDTSVGHLPGRLSDRDGSRIRPGAGRRRRHLRRVLPARRFALLSGAGGERTIAAGGDAMWRAALRVGVGWGAAKALPSIGAIRAGLINTLVTDEECAREILAIIAGEIAESGAVSSTPDGERAVS